MIVNIYGKPDCMACEATKRLLNKYNVEYLEIDVSTDEEALAYAQSLGYAKLPVVVAGDDHWCGFHPDKLARLRRFGKNTQVIE